MLKVFFLFFSLNAWAFDSIQTKARFERWFSTPHPFGSREQRNLTKEIVSELRSLGVKPENLKLQNFSVLTPSLPSQVLKSGTNILVRVQGSLENCIRLLGAHYDTKNVEGISYAGANDGGSGTLVLIELAKFFLSTPKKLECGLIFAWFDGEESTLPGWHDGEALKDNPQVDNTYGSRFFTASLVKPVATPPAKKNAEEQRPCFLWNETCLELQEVMIVDMVGSQPLTLAFDAHSSKPLVEKLRRAIAVNSSVVEGSPRGWGSTAPGVTNSNLTSPRVTMEEALKWIEDDHLPFVELGIPSLLIIDFFHLDTWHKSQDKPDSVSLESLELSVKIIQQLL